jgi:secretion system chaperone SscA
MDDTSAVDGLLPRERLDAVLQHGVSPGHFLGLDTQALESLYALACEDIQAERFEAAGERLAFLVQADPAQRHYQIGLALCLQELGQAEAAGRLYANALLSDSTDALCAYRIGECLDAMQAPDEAREAYDAAIRLSWLHPDLQAVREQAQKRLDELSASTLPTGSFAS